MSRQQQEMNVIFGTSKPAGVSGFIGACRRRVRKPWHCFAPIWNVFQTFPGLLMHPGGDQQWEASVMRLIAGLARSTGCPT